MSFATTLAATAATAAAAAAAAAAVAVTTAAAAAIMQESPQSDFNGETINKEGSRSALDAPPPAPVSMSYVRRSRTTAIRIPPPPSSLWIPGHDCLEIFDFISDSTLIKFHTLVTSHKPTHGMSVDDLLSNLDFQAELKVWFIEARQVIEVWEQQVPGPEADAVQFVRMWRALSNIDNCGDYSDEEEHSSIKGIINVNVASAAPASSTAAAAATAAAAKARTSQLRGRRKHQDQHDDDDEDEDDADDDDDADEDDDANDADSDADPDADPDPDLYRDQLPGPRLYQALPCLTRPTRPY